MLKSECQDPYHSVALSTCLAAPAPTWPREDHPLLLSWLNHKTPKTPSLPCQWWEGCCCQAISGQTPPGVNIPLTKALLKSRCNEATKILLSTGGSFWKIFPLVGGITGYRAWASQSICLICSVSQQYISVNSISSMERHNCNLGAQPFERPTKQPWSIPTQQMRMLLRQFLNLRIILSLFFSLFSPLCQLASCFLLLQQALLQLSLILRRGSSSLFRA